MSVARVGTILHPRPPAPTIRIGLFRHIQTRFENLELRRAGKLELRRMAKRFATADVEVIPLESTVLFVAPLSASHSGRAPWSTCLDRSGDVLGASDLPSNLDDALKRSK